MSFMIENNDVLVKYDEIWNKIKMTLSIKFHSIKAKVREFNDVIKTNFLGSEVPREGVHYTCIACIYDYWFCYENGKKELLTSLFR